MALALSAPVFAITSQLIEDATGLHYDIKDADLLAERLSRRAGELGCRLLPERPGQRDHLQAAIKILLTSPNAAWPSTMESRLSEGNPQSR